ncbi:Na+/H+ antiporter NhaA [Miniimonas sp. S16]|uniref:Na+/H+ antiporter NhaA n=1 Tax=Miniimonas sp. S16 TaxID=2171623 RepID=UPI000D5267E3|nr:Na+/H+ antiporter NhaA [Miniimonas sp. S16]
MPGSARRALERTLDALRTDAGSALLLVAVTLVALVWANSPLSPAYERLVGLPIGLQVGGFHLDLDLHHWVNDGLMVVFFFLIGLEVRRELAVGSLRERSRAWVPLVAGVCGVVLPVLLYFAIAGGTAPDGWGVVVGTDTAFLLGALALVGPSMSSQLRVFLLTLTVVDDLIAVTVIGTVYTDAVHLVPLAVAVVALVALALLGRSRQWRSAPYVAVTVILWLATLESGVHPSLAGMLAGLLVPAAAPVRADVVRAKQLFRDYWQSPEAGVARSARAGLARSISVNERLHAELATPVALVVVPVFALVNAGVDLRGGVLADALASPVTWGVVVALVVGKAVGISGGAWLAVRLRLGRLPDGVGPGAVLGGAALSGIGFTMALLIASLALPTEQAREAVVGVLLGMALSWGLGWLVFRVARVRFGEEAADLPVRLTPEVDGERDHVRGPVDAPSTVVEYLDFECPFCARATGMWADLKAQLGDDVRYVVRHLPLTDVHPHAWDAAVAAEAAARQDAFWPMHDVLFREQHALEPEDLRRYAGELGLDLERFDADVADPALHDLVAANAASARASGARGTPTFFLDGERHRGPHDARTLVAALRAHAR